MAIGLLDQKLKTKYMLDNSSKIFSGGKFYLGFKNKVNKESKLCFLTLYDDKAILKTTKNKKTHHFYLKVKGKFKEVDRLYYFMESDKYILYGINY